MPGGPGKDAMWTLVVVRLWVLCGAGFGVFVAGRVEDGCSILFY